MLNIVLNYRNVYKPAPPYIKERMRMSNPKKDKGKTTITVRRDTLKMMRKKRRVKENGDLETFDEMFWRVFSDQKTLKQFV